MMNTNAIKSFFAGRTSKTFAQRSYAVLVPVIEVGDSPHLLYQVRSMSIRQPGEVSFPGGKIEEGESPLQAALREAAEEIGISPDGIEVIGELDALLNHEQSLIYPFLGLIRDSRLEDIQYNRSEVTSIFTVPIDYFLSHKPEIYKMSFRPDDDGTFPYERLYNGDAYRQRLISNPVCFYEYQEHIIWGLTANITRDFIRELIKKQRSQPEWPGSSQAV